MQKFYTEEIFFFHFANFLQLCCNFFAIFFQFFFQKMCKNFFKKRKELEVMNLSFNSLFQKITNQKNINPKMDTFCPNPKSISKKIAKKLQKSCKKIAKKLQKSCKKIAKKLQKSCKMRKRNFLLCKIFAKFLQILNLHTDFRPREESVKLTTNVFLNSFL